MVLSLGGEIGRRSGLKIRFSSLRVRVQVPPRRPSKKVSMRKDNLIQSTAKTIAKMDKVRSEKFSESKRDFPDSDGYDSDLYDSQAEHESGEEMEVSY